MTLTDHSAQPQKSGSGSSGARLGGFFGSLKSRIGRIFGIRRRSEARSSFAGMDYDELGKFSAEHQPPQRWWEEDARGLREPDPQAKTPACPSVNSDQDK